MQPVMRPRGILQPEVFWGEVEVPHLSFLPKFDNLEHQMEPCGLEEDMDRVWEETRMADDVRV